MLNTLKERLVPGMEIKTIKEKRSKYEITFLIGGGEIKEELPKTCAPGMQDKVVDHTIFGAMCKAAINKGDYKEGKEWMDRIISRSNE